MLDSTARLSAYIRDAPEASGNSVATISDVVGNRYEMARHAIRTATSMTVKFMMTARAFARPNTLAQCAASMAELIPVMMPPNNSRGVSTVSGTTFMAHSA